MDINEVMKKAIEDSNLLKNGFFQKSTDAPPFLGSNFDPPETLIDPGKSNKFRKDDILDSHDNDPFKTVSSKKMAQCGIVVAPVRQRE